jgi:hypothetical protein
LFMHHLIDLRNNQTLWLTYLLNQYLIVEFIPELAKGQHFGLQIHFLHLLVKRTQL